MNFSRQIGRVRAAGIPITDGLQVIAREQQQALAGGPAGEAARRSHQGTQFSDALAAARGRLFRRTTSGSSRPAETDRASRPRAGAGLDTTWNATSRPGAGSIRRWRIRWSCSRWPPSPSSCSAVTWVLPKFADFFSGLGAKLPLTTRMLIGVRELHQALLVGLRADVRRARWSSSGCGCGTERAAAHP